MTHASTTLPPLSEREYMQQILEAARWHQWDLRYHTYNSQRSQPGFPDLVLVRGPVCRFLEVKADRGKLTRAQRDWIDALSIVEKVTAHVVRPADWKFVEELLR